MKQMRDPLESLIVTPGGYRRLCYVGESDSDGRWTNGVLRAKEGDISYPVEDGIPRFHSGDGNGWDDDERREAQFRQMGVDPEKLIERNYDYMVNQWPEYDKYVDWIRRIAATRGPIIEIAVGPGGGATPMVLAENPAAPVVMNDIGLWPLRQWQKFARRMRTSRRSTDTQGVSVAQEKQPLPLWPNLGFAQFDATQMPIASGSVAAVVSMGGISNIQSQANTALKEAYRILRPGGTLYAFELLPDHKITPRCPPEMVAILRQSFPHMETGYRPVLEELGFDPVRIKPMGKRPLVPGEGGLSDFCIRHEVVMYLWQLRIWARKG